MTRGTRTLVALLSVDALLITLHLIHVSTGLLPAAAFSIETERGYGEIFQYAKEIALTLGFVLLLVRTKQALHATSAVFFAYLTLDDAAAIHERSGRILAELAGVPTVAGLAPRHVAELLSLAAVGAGFAIAFTVAWRSSDVEARRVSRYLARYVALLLFFGIVVDLIHETIPGGGALSILFGILEDGGEMVAMSLLVVAAGREVAIPRMRALPS